ncbi:MAG: hypothetical protein CMJ27_05815, partial [Phycisphaerae bacterium]
YSPLCLGAFLLTGSVRDQLGSSSRIRSIPYAEAYDEGFEDLRVRQPDLTRIKRAINFRPAITIEQTIDDIAAALMPNEVKS